MTLQSDVDTVMVSNAGAPAAPHSYVDWPAIFGGIILASAIALIMLTFGSAIGLSFANFHGGTSVSPVWVGIAAASWLLWVEISAAMCGGYLTGRLRRRNHDASEHESDVRDGAHGLIVWAGATIIGAMLVTSGIGAAASAIGNVAGTATTAAATAAGPAAGAAASKSAFDPTSYFADALFRPATTAGTAPAAGATPAAAATTPAAATPAAAGTPPATAMASSTDRAAATAEAGRILASDAISGNVPDTDKTYLADLVARNTGMSADDAKKRVNDVMTQIDAAKAKAADAAETARKAAVMAAFITAASLLVAAVGAFWAAMMGGNHRDKEVVFDYWFRRF